MRLIPDPHRRPLCPVLCVHCTCTSRARQRTEKQQCRRFGRYCLLLIGHCSQSLSVIAARLIDPVVPPVLGDRRIDRRIEACCQSGGREGPLLSSLRSFIVKLFGEERSADLLLYIQCLHNCSILEGSMVGGRSVPDILLRYAPI